MVCYNFYCEFITSFHTDYNGEFLKTLSWCYKPKNGPDGFIEFINRSVRNYIDIVFFAKYDRKNKNIIIRCEYNYFEYYNEKSETTFTLNGYKNNTYNYMNIDGCMINHLADEEILSFIKLFDQFFLEQTHIPLLDYEYDLYTKYILNFPELICNYQSKKFKYDVDMYYNREEQGLIIRFNFHNKRNNHEDSIEYYIFKNRLVGDDFNDLDIELNNEILKQVDEIYINFTTFVELRLKN